MADPLLSWGLYLAAGAVAGLLGGLLGVGGGLVVVPALTLAFTLQGLPESVRVHLAVGTSLATIAATSIASVRAHHRLRRMSWVRVRELAPAVAAGAVAGAGLARLMPGMLLQDCVGAFALAVAMRMGFGLLTVPAAGTPYRPASAVAGGVIGAVSAVVGIGGGTLTVPHLLRRGTPIHEAVPVASACGLPIAVCGAAGFAVLGWGTAGLPASTLGYVSLPAFVAVAMASVACAPVGARLAHALTPQALRRGFAVVLGLVGVAMLVK